MSSGEARPSEGASLTGGAPLVGVLGGSFNPIHAAHLRVAEEVAEALALERVLFVPSARPPHKTGDAARDMATAEERLAWTRLATEDNPRFEVDPLELEREGPSYSVDTLHAIRERIAPAEPVFVIGQDAFVEIGTWWKPDELLTLAHVLVVTRPPVLAGALRDWTPETLRDAYAWSPEGDAGRHREAGTWIRTLGVTPLDISASGIRERIRRGASVRYLMPEKVRLAVLASGAYTPGETPNEPAGTAGEDA